jgi:hypothetical protein
MSDTINNEIASAIRKIARTENKDFLRVVRCVVDKVNLGSRIIECTPNDSIGDTKYENVSMLASIDDGFILVPKVDSEILVLDYGVTKQPLAIQYSELEEAYLICDKIQFNDGKLGGLVKVNDLKTQLNTLQSEINTLKTLVGAAISVYSGILDGGASAATFNAAVLPQINLSNIENKKIKQ